MFGCPDSSILFHASASTKSYDKINRQSSNARAFSPGFVDLSQKKKWVIVYVAFCCLSGCWFASFYGPRLRSSIWPFDLFPFSFCFNVEPGFEQNQNHSLGGRRDVPPRKSCFYFCSLLAPVFHSNLNLFRFLIFKLLNILIYFGAPSHTLCFSGNIKSNASYCRNATISWRQRFCLSCFGS